MAKHREIKEIRLDRITSGAWPPGTAISHEARLAEEFDVTRPAVSTVCRKRPTRRRIGPCGPSR